METSGGQKAVSHGCPGSRGSLSYSSCSNPVLDQTHLDSLFFFTNTGALVLFPGIPIQYIQDKDQPFVCFKRQQVIFEVQPGLKKHKVRVWKNNCDFGQGI